MNPSALTVAILLALGAGLVPVRGEPAVLIVSPAAPVRAAAPGAANARVLAAIARMPAGGGYATTHAASEALGKAISMEPHGRLTIKAGLAEPSFCSGATYLVLLQVLQPEIDKLRDAEQRQSLCRLLMVDGQADGVGIWGRWNSNGPCMAKLFHDARMGRSFWDLRYAMPGDFVKLWWKDAIGRDEAGHSAVFIGCRQTATGEEAMEIWSSNTPAGFGRKLIPLTRIHHMLFSRCEHPEQVVALARLPAIDPFLAEMLRRNTTREEISRHLAR